MSAKSPLMLSTLLVQVELLARTVQDLKDRVETLERRWYYLPQVLADLADVELRFEEAGVEERPLPDLPERRRECG